jgi:hypothetical protein
LVDAGVVDEVAVVVGAGLGVVATGAVVLLGEPVGVEPQPTSTIIMKLAAIAPLLVLRETGFIHPLFWTKLDL